MSDSTSVIKAIAKRLFKRRLFYICRDIERALGIGLPLKNYYIITNHNKFSASLTSQYPHIILIKEKEQLDTNHLLAHKQTKNIIKKNDFVLVFKNNALIEAACQKNGWCLLNPDSKLADKIESKISQIAWLKNLTKYLPPHQVDICGHIKWRGKSFIIQFNHSHTGGGTLLVDSEKKLADLKLKFFQRAVRIMKYIKGPVFTNNNVVWGNKILTGNINYQITGIPPFTENRFATIGNDWALPHKVLSTKQVKEYKKIVTEIGNKLKKDGWKGLYGVDMIVDQKTERLYLLEINARQPASTTFESQLQRLVIPTPFDKLRTGSVEESLTPDERDLSTEFIPLRGLEMTKLTTTFEAHLAGLLNVPNKGYKLISISDGAQIIQRITKKINKITEVKIKDSSVLNIIKYNNTSPGQDLIRFQFSKGLMKKHNTLNTLGKKTITIMI